METQLKILRKEEQITTKWSGGYTTELDIYPKDSKYIDRNFEWRISTAIIEAERTNFTSLSEYKRCLMLLDGEIELNHEGHHTSSLVAFEKDIFLGSWNTESIGKGTDFNLMLNKNWNGDIEIITMKYNDCIDIEQSEDKSKLDFIGIYCFDGEINIQIDDSYDEVIKDKDFTRICLYKINKVNLIAKSNSKLILTRLKKASL